MAPGGHSRKIRVKNIPAEPGGAEYRSLAGDLLSIGIGWAVLPVNLLPPGLRDQVKDFGGKMLRGLAGLNHDVAEGLERAADRLR